MSLSIGIKYDEVEVLKEIRHRIRNGTLMIGDVIELLKLKNKIINGLYRDVVELAGETGADSEELLEYWRRIVDEGDLSEFLTDTR